MFDLRIVWRLDEQPSTTPWNPGMKENDEAFQTAFASGDEAAIRAAVAAGVALNAAGPDGELPIVHAAKRGDAARAELLQRLGANANATANRGWSAIALAAQAEEPDMLWALLQGGASPDGDGTLQGTPIFIAAFEGLVGNLRLLVDAGANLAVVDTDYGRTALILAIRNGNDQCAKLLADAGCPAHSIDLSGLAAIDHARAEDRAEVLQWLEPIALAQQERAALGQASAIGSERSEPRRV